MYKDNIEIGDMTTGHVQGIATDAKRKYMYFSFTTCLLKTDMDGKILGSVRGLAGHLGCIAYNEEDGRVYGSLEYKHDSIGMHILQTNGIEADITDGFYVAVFDVDKIDRMDMDAERDGIMTAVHLDAVLQDYMAEGHRYGCSGIDGLTFAPLPGTSGGEKYLYVAYGIYGDISRDDNDYQVILRYDIRDWRRFEKPLEQRKMHRQGPDRPDSKYFVYTGNTTYGIQNLEYDAATGCMLAAVYRGRKADFPNYPMYAIDLQKPATVAGLGSPDETGEILQLAALGERDAATGIWGIEFPYGATGIISLGDGHFYFSRETREGDTWGTSIGLYVFDGKTGFIKK